MKTVIKGITSIEEYKMTKDAMEKQASLAYERHMSFVKDWSHGKPVKAWFDNDGNICVEYESGKWWHYKNLDLPFPTWW